MQAAVITLGFDRQGVKLSQSNLVAAHALKVIGAFPSSSPMLLHRTEMELISRWRFCNSFALFLCHARGSAESNISSDYVHVLDFFNNVTHCVSPLSIRETKLPRLPSHPYCGNIHLTRAFERIRAGFSVGKEDGRIVGRNSTGLALRFPASYFN
jgi:hypothetical protein